MRRYRIVSAVLTAALALAGCESSSNVLDKLQDSVADLNPLGSGEKPLPGQRKPLFPEGIPGVQQGIPQELVAGNRQRPTDEQVTGTVAAPSPPARARQAAIPEEAKPRPKSTAQPKPALRQSTRPEAEAPAPREDAVWPPPPTQSSAPRPSQAPPSPWPDQPQAAGAPQAASPWPSQTPPPPPAWPTPR